MPHVKVTNELVQGNKKMTSISGIELFKINPDELSAYLSTKCAASSTFGFEVGSVKMGAKETAVV